MAPTKQQEIIQQTSAAEADFHKTQRSFEFWAIIIGLGVTLWLAALENSVLTTAAPAVLKDIPLSDNCIRLTNAFFLSSAAFQPLLGQLADLFGRRWLTMCVVAVFMLGSGICGGATNGAMLIAGHAVQGIGSDGVLLAYESLTEPGVLDAGADDDGHVDGPVAVGVRFNIRYRSCLLIFMIG